MKRTMTLLLALVLVVTAVLPVCSAQFRFRTDYTDFTAMVGDETLPLPEFPVGSYCSQSGGPCTTAAGSLRYYPKPDGSGYVDTLGYQCMGFARYVFWRCFGVVDFGISGGTGFYAVVTYQYNVTASGLKALADDGRMRPGAHIRAGSENDGHSMVYIGCDDKYVYTYEGNYDNRCGVTVNQRTWAELASFINRKGYLCYIHMPNVYPEPSIWDCSVSGHQWQQTASIPPTCISTGEASYQCIICGETKTELLALGDHLYEATVAQPATEMNEGLMDLVCRVCGYAFTEIIPPLSRCDGSEYCPGQQFTDMPAAEHWAHTGIDCMLRRGLFSGTSQTTFDPEGTMTRAMLVTVLHRLAGKPEAGTASGFTDVKSDQWYADAVSWAAENGIVCGVGESRFDPEGKVTREQIAVFLHRYAVYSGESCDGEVSLADYPDAVKVSDYAGQALSWAVGAGLITGSNEGGTLYLQPNGSAQRQQVAAILQRYLVQIMGL